MTAPEESWTDWIAHDGTGCPVLAGQYIEVVGSRGGTEGIMRRPGFSSGWDRTGMACPVVGWVHRYRIRKPRALVELIALVETLPAPAPHVTEPA